MSWKNIALTLDKKGVQLGRMTGVTVQLFDGEAKGDTITAKFGDAAKATNVLRLYGDVTVQSPDRKSPNEKNTHENSTLKCDTLTYDSHKKLFFATGNVSLQNQVGTIRNLSKLIATADNGLKTVGSPDDFKLP